jgi:hypothetical protein
VSATRTAPPGAIPELRFAVVGARSARPAAVPTLQFTLQVDAGEDRDIRAVLLDVQIQIAARRRGYPTAAQDRLLELFGTPDRWGTTLRTLPWTRVTVVVPRFTATTTVDVPVHCTYDLEVTAARYLAALDDGDVPLEFLFSGTVFYTTPEGALQTARISWSEDADFALPVDVFRQTMDDHFPGAAWLRLGGPAFARLAAYKARHAFTGWDATIDALLGPEETP